MILLSICIPVYRPDKKFVNKIIALSDHLTPKTEIIIYVDGFYSEFRKIQEGFGARVNIFGSEKNSGVAFARNMLIHKANGEYILWMDSDDNLDISYLENLYLYLGHFDILYADRYLIESKQKRYIRGFNGADRRMKNLSKIAFLSFKINKEIGSTATCSKIIRKSVYDKVGLYDVRFRRSEDTEWFSRCLDHPELVFGSFDQPLISQVYTNNSYKSNKSEWFYQVKLLIKNRDTLSDRDLIFSYQWLCFKYRRNTKSLVILSVTFFYRFYVKLLSKLLKPSSHIIYTS